MGSGASRSIETAPPPEPQSARTSSAPRATASARWTRQRDAVIPRRSKVTGAGGAGDTTDPSPSPSGVLVLAFHGGKDAALARRLAVELGGVGMTVREIDAAAAGGTERRAARAGTVLAPLLTAAFVRHKGCRRLLEEAVTSGAEWLPLLEGSAETRTAAAAAAPWLALALEAGAANDNDNVSHVGVRLDAAGSSTRPSGPAVRGGALGPRQRPPGPPFVLDVVGRGGELDRERLYQRLLQLLRRLLQYPLGLSLRGRMSIAETATATKLGEARKSVTCLTHDASLGIGSPLSSPASMAAYEECVLRVHGEDRDGCRQALAAALTLSFEAFGQAKLLQAGLARALVIALNRHGKTYPDVALLAVTAMNHVLHGNPGAQEAALGERVLPALLRLMTQHSNDPAVLLQCCVALQYLCGYSSDAAGSQAQTLMVQAMQHHLLASPELAEECAATLLAMAAAPGMGRTARVSAWRAHLQIGIKEAQARLLPGSDTLQGLLQSVTRTYKG